MPPHQPVEEYWTLHFEGPFEWAYHRETLLCHETSLHLSKQSRAALTISDEAWKEWTGHLPKEDMSEWKVIGALALFCVVVAILGGLR